MIDTIRSWWSSLSQRERILVGIASALLSGLIGWFLILVPLQNALTNANMAHVAAIDREGAVRSRIATLNASRDIDVNPAAANSTASASVAQALTQAASEAGLPLARNDPAGTHDATIAISNGRSAAIMAFLAALEHQRIRASDLAIRPNGDGSINLTATLRRSGR